MAIDWKVVPIDWRGPRTVKRKPSPFRASWSQTVALLHRELVHLGATDILLQLAVRDRDIRLDGWVRANASPSDPGVVLTFESRDYGALSYPCDRFTSWQDNVRAIALALEALRKVDRYGVTRRGEQYRGWKALPPGRGTIPVQTPLAAVNTLAGRAGLTVMAGEVLASPAMGRALYRAAARAAHPDKGGSREAWDAVELAWRTLQAEYTTHHRAAT